MKDTETNGEEENSDGGEEVDVASDDAVRCRSGMGCWTSVIDGSVVACSIPLLLLTGSSEDARKRSFRSTALASTLAGM